MTHSPDNDTLTTTEINLLLDDHRRDLRIIIDAGLPAIHFALTHPIKTRRHLKARRTPFPQED